MEVTAEIKNVIVRVATNMVAKERDGTVAQIQREMDAFETGGDPDLESQKAAYYGGLLQQATDPNRINLKTEEIKNALTHRVQSAPDPAVPPAPRFVTWAELVDRHPDCRRRRVGSSIPFVGIVFGIRDQLHNERHAQALYEGINEENQRVYQEEVKAAYKAGYAYALGIDVGAMDAA